MKLNRKISACLMIVGALMAGTAQAGELVEKFTGDRSRTTGEFVVKGPWLLDWRVGGEYTREMAVDVTLVEVGTQQHMGNVLKTKSRGNGVRLFEESGRFFFRVDSTLANWTLKVEQLTPEEAELYTPKNQTRLDY